VNTFEKVLRSVTEKMAFVSMVAIVACMVFVVSDIIRYHAIDKPIPGTHEVVELIAAVILSMGIAYLTFVRGHVAVGLIVDRFRPRVQAAFDVVTSAIALGFTIWLTAAMVKMAILNFRYGWVTGALGIPRYPFMYLISAALALTCVVLITHVVKAVIMVRTGGGA